LVWFWFYATQQKTAQFDGLHIAHGNISLIAQTLQFAKYPYANKMHHPVLLGRSPSLLTRTFLTHSLCPWNVFTQKLQCTESLTVSLKGWDPEISCLAPCKPGSSSLNRMTYVHRRAKGTGKQIY